LPASIFSKWTSLDDRIGRKEYWLYYLLPSAVILLLSAFIANMVGEGVMEIGGIASAGVFIIGNVKRIRDLNPKVPAWLGIGAGMGLMGLWMAVMTVATVAAGGLFLVGLLIVMGNGGSGGEAMMVTAAVIFIAPIVVPPGIVILVAGFVPGSKAKQSTDLPSSGTDIDSDGAAHANLPEEESPGSA
jgi:hypothetical protein